MKKSNWQLWAVLAAISLTLAGTAVWGMVRAPGEGSPDETAILFTAGWSILVVAYGHMSTRGYLGEKRYSDRSTRLERRVDPGGSPTLCAVNDPRGHRVDTVIYTIGFALLAAGGAGSKIDGLKIGAWASLMCVSAGLGVLIRNLRFPPHFRVSTLGIDCQYPYPALAATWDEIVSVRASGSPSTTGSLYITLTPLALSRFDPKTRKRLERLYKRKKAHSRWIDAGFYSSAAELGSIVQHFRDLAKAPVHIPTGLGEPLLPPPDSATPSPTTSGTPGDAERARWAGMLIVAGGTLRVGAYLLPWVVASAARTVSLSGLKLHFAFVSIGLSLGPAILAAAYLRGRTWVTPQFLVGVGIGSILSSIVNAMLLVNAMNGARQIFVRRGEVITIGAGAGPWVNMAGAVVILAGGIWAWRLQRRAPAGESLVPAVRNRSGAGLRLDGAMQSAVGVAVVVLFIVAITPLATFGAPRNEPGQPSGSTVPSSPPPSPSPSPSPSPTVLPPPPPDAIPRGPDATAYQADVAHDGDARNAGVDLPLTPAWNRSFDGEVGSPLIAGGRVFVAVTNRRIERPSQVMALDAATGRTLWRHKVGKSSTAGLAYDAGSLFVLDQAGVIKRYEATRGKLRWKVLTASGNDSSGPTAWGGRVYASSGQFVVSLDEKTGAEVWKHGFDGGLGSVPTLVGQHVLVANLCLRVDALAARDGALAWRYPGMCSGGISVETTAYYDGRIYSRDGNDCVVINASTGGQLAKFACSAIPAFGRTTGYFMDMGTLLARDTISLKTLWSYTGDGALNSAPLVMGNRVLVGSSHGHLYELRPDGHLVDTFVLGASASASYSPDSPGMNAGDGILAIPASDRLVVYR